VEAAVYCLVDSGGTVHVTRGATSYADVAAACGVDENACRKYRFVLPARRLVADQNDPSSERSASLFLANCVGTPERLMAFAAEGWVTREALLELLSAPARAAFLDACGAIERQYTEACAAADDPCLESGCAIAGENGERCLQPLLRSRADYDRACTDAWLRSFAAAGNRVEVWRH
jgi:hypothetical protein